VTAVAVVEWVAFVAGVGLATWQFRWLLRKYRRERDRQSPEHRSARWFLLVLALAVFVILAALTGMGIARRIAVGAILVLDVVEWLRRRRGQ
jgi:hypothetical protein